MPPGPTASPRLGRDQITSIQNPVDTQRKALAINLDQRRYGTFAEIGAGQEVVRWFFQVGAASGTIAKSISAYDMQVSDAIYGETDRYVSRARLKGMLEYEQRLNVERLAASRGDTTAFFAFADTVAAQRYGGGGESHAWMGIRFLAHPRDEDSQIILHARMLDTAAIRQREALGILGVNLVFGALCMREEPEAILGSLLDCLSTDRIEIDMVEFSGNAFRLTDNRIMSLRLVELGLTRAAMFSPEGEVMQPADALHRRPVLVQRGRFRPPTLVHLELQDRSLERFRARSDVDADRVVAMLELTLEDLRVEGRIDVRDFLDRVETLAGAGLTLLVSDYVQYYRLATYLARCTSERIAFPLGAGTLARVLDPSSYVDLSGGMLEALGLLFNRQVTLYVSPWIDPVTGERVTLQSVPVPEEHRALYEYICSREGVEAIDDVSDAALRIYSDDVLEKLQRGDSAWEAMVPARIVDVIKRGKRFGYGSRR